jgi:hypothetical protein
MPSELEKVNQTVAKTGSQSAREESSFETGIDEPGYLDHTT